MPFCHVAISEALLVWDYHTGDILDVLNPALPRCEECEYEEEQGEE